MILKNPTDSCYKFNTESEFSRLPLYHPSLSTYFYTLAYYGLKEALYLTEILAHWQKNLCTKMFTEHCC